MAEPVLELLNIHRTYVQGEGEDLHVLRGLNLTLRPGEIVALVGESGAGKSTLLQVAGLLDRPDGGDILLKGQKLSQSDDAARTRLRSRHLGFVYQFHHLLPEFSAVENVVIPQLIAGSSSGAASERAKGLLGQMGLSNRLEHRPSQLSGGEQQRVAIARALANAPSLLLADEPTGNLDDDTSEHVFQLLLSTVREHGLSALIATHNRALAARMDRTVTMRDGVLV